LIIRSRNVSYEIVIEIKYLCDKLKFLKVASERFSVRLLDLKVQTLNFARGNFRKIITFKHDGMIFKIKIALLRKDRMEDNVTLIMQCHKIGSQEATLSHRGCTTIGCTSASMARESEMRIYITLNY